MVRLPDLAKDRLMVPADRMERFAKGSVVYRVHPDSYSPVGGVVRFNDSDRGSARFSPIQDRAAKIIPTLYAGVTYSLTDIPNIRQKGTRLGNWLNREQAKELLAVPDRSTLKGKRDYVILALLVGCALRRNELAELDVETIQQREGRWVLADLEGKGRRIRTVAIPIWVKHGINAWMTAAGIEDGRLLRSVSKSGKVNRDTLSDWAVWSVVEQSSKQIGIEHFGAHDLRRTCAKLCRKNGGDLEQIKFLLGHSSIQTTERYLGSEQDIEIAVNDNLGL
jgi:integrase